MMLAGRVPRRHRVHHVAVRGRAGVPGVARVAADAKTGILLGSGLAAAGGAAVLAAGVRKAAGVSL